MSNTSPKKLTSNNPTNSKTSINTHDYDTLLKDKYKHYVKIDDEELELPIYFEDIITEIKENTNNKNAIRSCDLMLKDRKNNYDDKNEINVEDLLPRTWRFIKHYDDLAKECFYEQLGDISLKGSCSQGRITRIFQFYNNHMETKDEIYERCKKKK